MNERERLIFELIRKNPFLSQQEIADSLQMSRPAVANVISGLMKRGAITGRAYVIPESKRIVCIGGANVDRKFHLKKTVQFGTSNPSTLSVAIGGVARNIGENLGRLGHKVQLLSTAGPDADWDLIHGHSSPFIDLSAVQLLAGHSTGSYSAVIEQNGELAIAMATMDVYSELSPDYIRTNERHLAGAAMIVIDLNCPKETVETVKEIAQTYRVPLSIAPVSSPKMVNMPESLEGITWFICNEDEAETLTGIRIDSREAWELAVRKLLDAGVGHAVITRGAKGVMSGNRGHEEVRHFEAVPDVPVQDVTGAGDAFIAALLHGVVSGWEPVDCIHAGRVNAAKTLAGRHTVRPELSEIQLENDMEEYR